MSGPEAGYLGYVYVATTPSPTHALAQVMDSETPLTTTMWSTTALGAGGWETFLAGIRSGVWNGKLSYDQTDTLGQLVITNAYFATPPTLLYFIVSPNGTNTLAFTAYVKDYKVHDPANGKVDLDLALQITGAVTNT